MSTKHVDTELLEAEEELKAIYDGTLGFVFIDDEDEFCDEDERPWFNLDDPFDEEDDDEDDDDFDDDFDDDDDDDDDDENWLGFNHDSERGW